VEGGKRRRNEEEEVEKKVGGSSEKEGTASFLDLVFTFFSLLRS